MNDLIRIFETNGIQAVDARELHYNLGAESRFNDWIRRRIKEYGFAEGVDYTFYSNLSKTLIGRPTKEYALTISCAKELSMVEGNKKGKALRLYFIECERRLQTSSLQQRLAILEQQVAELRGLLVSAKISPKARQLPSGIEADLVAKHFAPAKRDEVAQFMSCMEIAKYIQTAERIRVGPYRVAKALIQLTNQHSSIISVGGHSTKRGYWVKTLTSLV